MAFGWCRHLWDMSPGRGHVTLLDGWMAGMKTPFTVLYRTFCQQAWREGVVSKKGVVNDIIFTFHSFIYPPPPSSNYS